MHYNVCSKPYRKFCTLHSVASHYLTYWWRLELQNCFIFMLKIQIFMMQHVDKGDACMIPILSYNIYSVGAFSKLQKYTTNWNLSTQSGVIKEILLEIQIDFSIFCCLFSSILEKILPQSPPFRLAASRHYKITNCAFKWLITCFTNQFIYMWKVSLPI